MKPEFHLARIRESLEMTADAVTKGAATHQRTIGWERPRIMGQRGPNAKTPGRKDARKC